MTTPPPAPPPATEVTAVTDTQSVTLPDPLQLPLKSNEIYGRRKPADKAQWGTAAPSHSNSFRSHDGKGKPKAKRWDHLFSDEGGTRTGNSLKKAAKFLGKPGLISLGGGIPTSDYFPFDSMTLTVPNPPHFGTGEIASTGAALRAGKHDLAAGTSLFDVATAFNYGQGTGAAQLLRWITEHTELVHDPPYADWACTMSVGSTSGLDMALRLLARPGDYLLAEEYTFSTAIDCMTPLGVRAAGVAMDAEGMLPDALAAVLTHWNPAERGGAARPRLLYAVPTGQNPTGSTAGAQRRRALYAVAQQYDLYIIEDDPYYFLQMQAYTGAGQADAPAPRSHAAFLDALAPSFLRLDVDGRVMRLDSFSKVVSPGARVGWVTAPARVVERYTAHTDVSTQGPSGVSQLALFKLLDEHWGHEGYLDWLVHLRLEYTRRRDVILDACERFLPREVASWDPPMAGMFHWIRIAPEKHPAHATKSVDAIEEDVFFATIARGALVMRGSWFYADPAARHDAIFFRATYAAAPSDHIHEAIRRFGDALREVFQLPAAEGGIEGATNGTNGVSGEV